MTLTIELEPEEAARLEQAAQQEGLDLVQYARRRLGLRKPKPQTPDAENQALIALIDSWRAEDATEDPEELARRDAELEEFKANMNANRAAEGRSAVYP